MDCEYLIRAWHGERPHRIVSEVCSLTGRACFLQEPAATYRTCTRRDWALSYQARHAEPAEEPAGAPESPLNGRLPA